MTEPRANYAPEVNRALSDARRVCELLGLTAGGPRTFQKQASGVIVRCPVHAEHTASCSVQTVKGVLLWKCHGCQASGDAIALVAAVRGMSLRGRGFREVLAECARLAGRWDLVSAIEGRADAPPRAALPAPRAAEAPEATRAYPADAGAFWAGLGAANEDAEVCAYLRSRAIGPDAVESRDLARVIPDRGALPPWARYRGRTWRETGHRLIVPMFDAGGELRSVRAWRICDDDSPKRLPPGGHKASELVMADPWGLAWLRGTRVPRRIVVAEGEPDWGVWASRLNDPQTATLGIVSGSWHAALAARVPVGCRVDVRTDADEVGERYFAEIAASLKRVTPDVFRLKVST